MPEQIAPCRLAMHEQECLGTAALVHVMHLEAGDIGIVGLERPGAVEGLVGRDGRCLIDLSELGLCFHGWASFAGLGDLIENRVQGIPSLAGFAQV